MSAWLVPFEASLIDLQLTVSSHGFSSVSVCPNVPLLQGNPSYCIRAHTKDHILTSLPFQRPSLQIQHIWKHWGLELQHKGFWGDTTQHITILVFWPISTHNFPDLPSLLSLFDFIPMGPFHASLPGYLLLGSSITFVTTRGGDLEDQFCFTHSSFDQYCAQQMLH